MPPPGGIRTSLAFTMAGGGPLASTFQPSQGLFSPGLPVPPGDPQPVRVIPFHAGVNTIIQPRAYEPITFAQLRAFANVELVRLAIETRKDQIERMDWRIKVRDQRRPRSDAEERIRRVERFWRKPDGETPFGTWLRMSMEDLLVLDAPAFEKRRNRGGGLIGLDIVAGDTIKLLVDSTGRRPKFPAPAYHQVLYGRTWAQLTTQDLLYVPRNRRPHKLYGYGAVEQIVVTINTILQRQASQLFHFGIGNIPAGLLTAPDGWSSDMIAQYQTWFDDKLSGNVGEKAKLIWTPNGTKYQSFKDPPLKDEFDEWLARIVCYCFSLPVTPFIRAVNRATAEQTDQTALEEGREPLLRWWKRIADDVIADELQCPDLEWVWQEIDDIDPEKRAKIDDVRLRNGSMTINEARDQYGDAPVAGGDTPRIYIATGAVSLEGTDETEDVSLESARVQIDQIKNGDGDAPPRKPRGVVQGRKAGKPNV